MMQINLMIPLFTVPEGASLKKIIEEIKLLVGFEQIIIYELQQPDSIPKKGNPQQQLGVEVKDMKISVQQISQLMHKITELQRQNQMLRKDLADLYTTFITQTTKVQITSKEKAASMFQLSNKDEEISSVKKIEKQLPNLQKQKSNDENKEGNENRWVQKEIQKLVREKRSKQEIIEKLSVYCECLLKIIENNKLPIF